MLASRDACTAPPKVGHRQRRLTIAPWSHRKRAAAMPRGVVPVERIELPTFGLQNRCTTAVLHRRRALPFAETRPQAVTNTADYSARGAERRRYGLRARIRN